MYRYSYKAKKKKKKSVSQRCRPHLFFCAHLILQNSDFHFFFLKLFFFHFYYEKQRKFAVLEEFKHVGAQKTCKIPFDFWKYGSWNFSVIFGFGCAWRQRPIEVKKNKIENKKTHAASVWKILASFETEYFFFFLALYWSHRFVHIFLSLFMTEMPVLAVSKTWNTSTRVWNKYLSACPGQPNYSPGK